MEIEDVLKLVVNSAVAISFLAYYDMNTIYMLQQYNFDKEGVGING